MKDKFKTWAPFLAIALAVVLFAGGTVGNVRAALTYYSDNYDLEIEAELFVQQQNAVRQLSALGLGPE